MRETQAQVTVFGTLPSRNIESTHISKMKSFIVFALLVAAAVALPVDSKDAETLESSNDNIGTGPYSHSYKTSDGKSAFEQAVVKNLGAEGQTYEIHGEYSYPGPDGVIYTVTYVADENGFRAQGAHLPA